MVVLGVILAMTQLPFVVWSAGSLTNIYAGTAGQPRLTITGAPTYETTGKLQVASVAVTKQTVSLWRALPAYYNHDDAVLPQVVSFPVGLPIAQVATEQGSAEPQRAAEAAALRQVGLPVERAPRVVAVVSAGPSFGWLLPDDVIEGVDSSTVTSVAEFNQALAMRSVGDTVQLTVNRAGVRLDSKIDVVAQASNNEQQTPSLGLILTDSFLLGGVDIQGAPTDIGSGLILAIGIYDLLTPGGLLGSLSVAGTGVVDANGVVSGVAGANERLRAARSAGAAVFLVPRSNCANLYLPLSGITVVAVSSLAESISALQTLAGGAGPGAVPTCPA